MVFKKQFIIHAEKKGTFFGSGLSLMEPFWGLQIWPH